MIFLQQQQIEKLFLATTNWFAQQQQIEKLFFATTNWFFFATTTNRKTFVGNNQLVFLQQPIKFRNIRSKKKY